MCAEHVMRTKCALFANVGEVKTNNTHKKICIYNQIEGEKQQPASIITAEGIFNF